MTTGAVWNRCRKIGVRKASVRSSLQGFLVRFTLVCGSLTSKRIGLETLRVRNDDSEKLCCDEAGKGKQPKNITHGVQSDSSDSVTQDRPEAHTRSARKGATALQGAETLSPASIFCSPPP